MNCMNERWTKLRFLAAIALFAAACSDGGKTVVEPPDPPPVTGDTAAPPLLREFRGVWIATVANIDWPSRNNLTMAQQQAELATLLDRAQATGLNAVVFHIRPASDAVYRSALEPWALLLTGTQGADPGWDPLEW